MLLFVLLYNLAADHDAAFCSHQHVCVISVWRLRLTCVSVCARVRICVQSQVFP